MAAVATPPQHYSAKDFTDFYHTGPETLAGRWWRTFWQPVCRSEDFPVGRAKPVRLFSEDFTVYRGESGRPQVVAFRCAHRGTQLSTGWVEGDNLRCFYHGWTYDMSGQCVEQPAEPEPFCQKIRIRSYPTEEYLGLVFAYLGEGEPPEFPRYPDFEEEPRYVTTHTLACNVIGNLDGHPDHGHLPFVHGRGGRKWRQTGEYGLRPVFVEENEFGISTPAGDNQHGMPNVLIHIRPPGLDRQDVLRWRLPIDDESHRDFSVFVGTRRGLTYTETSERAAEVTEAILRGEMTIEEAEANEERSCVVIVQDAVAQIGLGRIPYQESEHLGREDAGLILKRRIWEREMSALADGEPLTQWRRPERLYRHAVRANAHSEEFVES